MRWWAGIYGTAALAAVAGFISGTPAGVFPWVIFAAMSAGALLQQPLPGRSSSYFGYLLMFTGVSAFALKTAPIGEPSWTIGLSLMVIIGTTLWLSALFQTDDDRPDQRWERVLSWILCAFIGLLVAYYSSPAGGAGPMVGFLTRVLGLSPEVAGVVVIVIRKTLHFTFYGVLALASARAIRLSGVGNLRAVNFGLLWALAHAVYDELRQIGEVGRTGSGWDVLLDLAGILAFLSPQFRSAWVTIRSRSTSN